MNGKEYAAKLNGTSTVQLDICGDVINANVKILALKAGLIGNIYAGGQFKNDVGYHYVAKYSILGGAPSVQKNRKDSK